MKVPFRVELLDNYEVNLLNSGAHVILPSMDMGSGTSVQTLASMIKALTERTLFRHGRLGEFKHSHYAEVRVRCVDGHCLYVSKHDDDVCITYVWPLNPGFEQAPRSGFEIRFECSLSEAECRVFGAFGHRDFGSIQTEGELETLHEMFNDGLIESAVFEERLVE